MAKVRYISTSIIRLAKNKPMRIDLTPWDLQLLCIPPIQFGLFYLKPKSSHTIVNHLKLSLSRTLELFPPLVGRLGIADTGDGETSSVYLDCNNAGALFAHASADVTVEDMLMPLYVPTMLRYFFLLNDTYNFEAISQPLLTVQVTELIDGFFIACTMNHVTSDGVTVWNFMQSWSDISRGFSANMCQLPVISRWFPNNINLPIKIPLPLTIFNDKFIFPPLEERVFHFSNKTILALKARANAEMNRTNISSQQALLAHLWRGIVRCRGTGMDQEVKYEIAINSRPRLEPPLPETYFGSAIVIDIVATTAGKLLNHSLGWAAWEMNKIAARQTNNGVRSFLKEWSENPKLLSLRTNNIITNGSPHFNFFLVDFGWGKPVMARTGSAHKSDGSIFIYRGVENGSIDISVCLLPENLHALGNDQEFMDTVTHRDMKLLIAKCVSRKSSL